MGRRAAAAALDGGGATAASALQLGFSAWPVELASPTFVKYLTVEIAGGRVPSIPLEMLAEFAPSIADAAPEEIVAAVRAHCSIAPPHATTSNLLDLFVHQGSDSGDGDDLCGALHFKPPAGNAVPMADMLREALTAEQPTAL